MSSGYSWPVIGWTSDLNSYTMDEAMKYWNIYYRPNNLVGFIVGDFKPAEIKPHPMGVELGTLMSMLKQTSQNQLGGFLTKEFCRVSPTASQQICEGAGLTTRSWVTKLGHAEAEALHKAFRSELHVTKGDMLEHEFPMVNMVGPLMYLPGRSDATRSGPSFWT